jgi:ADP-L-glycero-D-manno-heptose 6-epimerase
MKILITGVCGFIGGYVARRLKKEEPDCVVHGHDFIDLLSAQQQKSLLSLPLDNYIDGYDIFETREKYDLVIHMGAHSQTSLTDVKETLKNNFEFTKKLFEKFHYVIYASSASVYGKNREFAEVAQNEEPLNLYAYSKLLIDNYVRSSKDAAFNATGLRFFNVYGEGESHKTGLTSPIFSFVDECSHRKKITLFTGDDGFGNDVAAASRDFVYVGDCYDVIMWFAKKRHKGVFNVGTGTATSFYDVASMVYKQSTKLYHELNWTEKKEMPSHLVGKYQSYTKADLTNLRKVGYNKEFTSIEEGLPRYVDILLGRSE